MKHTRILLPVAFILLVSLAFAACNGEKNASTTGDEQTSAAPETEAGSVFETVLETETESVAENEPEMESETEADPEQEPGIMYGLEYELLADGTYSVVVAKPYAVSGAIVIPDTYKGKPVTSICRGFEVYEGMAITSVTLPKGLKEIGYDAFKNCDRLTSIEIPDGVTSIGNSAFSGCTGLTSITIPNSVISVGDNAFDDTGLAFYMYDQAKYLGSESNPYAILLESVSNDIVACAIHENTRVIASMAFFGCNALTGIEIPNGVTSIGEGAFFGCGGLTSITIPFVGGTKDGEKDAYNESRFDYIFGNSYTPENLKTVIITGGTSIAEGAFSGWDGLTSIEIPDSVTSIGDYAFYRCSGLTSIDIPDSVTSIGDSAFNGCSGLTSVTFAENSQLTSIGDRAFSGCIGLTSVEIPDSVTSIGEGAFCDCSELTSVTFAETKGWMKVELDGSFQTVSASDLSDPENAAYYLNSRYACALLREAEE